MKGMTGGILVLATILATGGAELTAQQGRRGREGQNMRGRQVGVETIMRMRDRLELTDEQIGQLDAIRRENVQRRTAEAAEIAELESQLAAGQLERSDVRAAHEARRDAQETAGDQRARIESVLTEDQRDRLGELGRRERAFAGGRAGRMQRRGGQRGFRGQRSGPSRGGVRGGRSGVRGGRSGVRGGRRGPDGGRALGNSRRGPGRWGFRNDEPGQSRRGPGIRQRRGPRGDIGPR